MFCLLSLFTVDIVLIPNRLHGFWTLGNLQTFDLHHNLEYVDPHCDLTLSNRAELDSEPSHMPHTRGPTHTHTSSVTGESLALHCTALLPVMRVSLI